MHFHELKEAVRVGKQTHAEATQTKQKKNAPTCLCIPLKVGFQVREDLKKVAVASHELAAAMSCVECLLDLSVWYFTTIFTTVNLVTNSRPR
jgi:hypothetical protein